MEKIMQITTIGSLVLFFFFLIVALLALNAGQMKVATECWHLTILFLKLFGGCLVYFVMTPQMFPEKTKKL